MTPTDSAARIAVTTAAMWCAVALTSCSREVPQELADRADPAPSARSAAPPRAGASDLAGAPRGSSPGRDPPRPASPAGAPAQASTFIRLDDVTGRTGVAFRHTDGSGGRHYIVETMSAGLATFDYDGDGRIDIYFPNGAPLPGAKTDRVARHALYRNLGDWRFRDVSEEAGVASTAFGLGVTVGDYDDDGRPDLYLSNFGPKVLYHNNGDGTFTDVTGRAGVADGSKVGAGVSFLDVDGDGSLDLYAANYVKFSFEAHVPRSVLGVPAYPAPIDYPSEVHALFRSRGDGSFADVSRAAGIARLPGPGMGIVACDFDDDGDTDVFVANDGKENFLWRNDGKGRFEEVAMLSGVAYDGVGQPHANMGVDCGDYDHDGRLDFYVTSYLGEWATLYRGLGRGLFADVTENTGAGHGTFQHVTWGCGFVDFDNDGHRDLFAACGHTDDNVGRWDDATSYRARNVLLRNTGDGRFEDVSDQCGDGMRVEAASRGAAFDDLDNDGDIDVVVLNSRDPPTILRNMLQESGSPHHWVQVRLQGVRSNRDGVGARVKVVAGDLVQFDEVHSGRGYQSHWGSRLHFGLGKRDRVDRIEVRWIGGGTDVVENVASDRLVTITEGDGAARPPRRNP